MSRPKALEPEEVLRIRKLREEGASIASCAAAFDCSESSVLRELRRLRRKLGPEKYRTNGQRARWYLIDSRQLEQSKHTGS